MPISRERTAQMWAEGPLTEVVRIRMAALGETHTQTMSARFNLASLYRNMGRLDSAFQTYGEVLALGREHLGATHPYVGYNLAEVGITHGRAGRPDEAIATYREALDVLRATLPQDHLEVTEAMGGMAYEMVRSGRARQASLGRNSWRTGVSESSLGECLMRLSRHDEAERRLVAGYEAIREAGGPKQAALRRLADFYDATGRGDRAAPYRARLAGLVVGPAACPTHGQVGVLTRDRRGRVQTPWDRPPRLP